MITTEQISLQLNGLPQPVVKKMARSYTKGADRLKQAYEAVRDGAGTYMRVASIIDCTPKHAAKLLDKLHELGKLDRKMIKTPSGNAGYFYKVKK